MKRLIGLMSICALIQGCDAMKALDVTANKLPATMEQMNQKMDSTVKGISETNSAVREQKMGAYLDLMFRDENTQDLEPVALGMIPGAIKLGEVITAKEAVELTSLFVNEIHDQRPSAEDANDPAVIKKYDHQKMAKFSAIVTIAGFLPDEKVDQIINDQIINSGLYIDEAYTFLMARVFFLGTFVNEKILANPINSIEKMNDAITKIESIDKILKLYLKDPVFKKLIKMDIDGFLKRDAISVSLYSDDGNFADPNWSTPKLWKKVLKAFDRDLKAVNLLAAPQDQKDEALKKINLMKARVQANLDSWK